MQKRSIKLLKTRVKYKIILKVYKNVYQTILIKHIEILCEMRNREKKFEALEMIMI